jgi:hypothetical protein
VTSNAELFAIHVTEAIALGQRLGLEVIVQLKPANDEAEGPIGGPGHAPLVSPPAPASGDEVVGVPGQAAYTEAMVAKLVDRVAHLPAAVAVLHLTSDQPGRWVLFEEVLAASDLPVNTARGQLSALSRYVASVLGVKGWPVEWHWRSDGTIEYRADARVAEWLRKALQDL